jgi:single-stranded-DNA-specific exonuclease
LRPAAKSATRLPPPTPSERAFEKALAAFDVAPRLAREPAPERDEFVERIFAQSESYLRDRYATIADASSFHTKIAGVSFEGRQDVIAGLRGGAPLQLIRQSDNPHDANAIAVFYGDLQLGFLNRNMAAHLAPSIDAGTRYRATIASLTGGAQKNRGVNIHVERDAAETIAQRERGRDAARVSGAERDAGATAERVRAALIGDAQPHEAQRAILERVERSRNTLAVLGTGRGKSFCFQFAAALRALAGEGKTLVVYPLRALANDQYAGMARTLDPLGLRIYRANGSIDANEREDLFEALREGAWDLVLATPEFLEFHRDAFTHPSVPSFLVVDEAHHLHESRHRPAYRRLAATIASLGRPPVLALTATAGDEAFRTIVEELRIEAWVIDPTVRENLNVVDARGTKDKIRYLAELFADGEKGIVYCNSRKEATTIARGLRKSLGNDVMFYHAKMPAAERLEVERLFREGQLRVVIATSAFGEGIDLPDVRHVVLYHLNFDLAEFNQQAGRAGRDGAPARIHLLYGESDRALNEYLIDLDAPSLPVLREIYRGAKSLAHDGVLRSGNAEIAGILGLDRVRDRTIAAALRIFADAQLVEIGEDDEGAYVRFLPAGAKVDMERNERYAEGEANRESFETFAKLALSASAATLERIINRPIYPGRVELTR